jgi:hypothetical protein
LTTIVFSCPGALCANADAEEMMVATTIAAAIKRRMVGNSGGFAAAS